MLRPPKQRKRKKYRRITLQMVWKEVRLIHHEIHKIMATQKEHAEELTNVGNQLNKALNELIKALANSGNTSAEVDAAMVPLKAAAAALDALNEDEVPPPPPEG